MEEIPEHSADSLSWSCRHSYITLRLFLPPAEPPHCSRDDSTLRCCSAVRSDWSLRQIIVLLLFLGGNYFPSAKIIILLH